MFKIVLFQYIFLYYFLTIYFDNLSLHIVFYSQCSLVLLLMEVLWLFSDEEEEMDSEEVELGKNILVHTFKNNNGCLKLSIFPDFIYFLYWR